MTTWLLLDCNFLSHRAYHAMGQLAFGDAQTGVAFGFFKEMLSLAQQFMTKQFVFAWDAPPGLRQTVYDGYKKSRADKYEALPPSEQAEIDNFRACVGQLRRDVKAIGYANSFRFGGYEADDVIAQACKVIPEGDGAVIVSADKDLYQLLTPRVRMYQPQSKKIVTHNSFKLDWGLRPKDWAKVKAIAGCSTDDIPGVKGVGEKTAAKYLRGELAETTKAYKSIISDDMVELMGRNRRLVQLPFAGCPEVTLRDEEPSYEKWNEVMDRYGIRTLQHRSRRGIFRMDGFGLF